MLTCSDVQCCRGGQFRLTFCVLLIEPMGIRNSTSYHPSRVMKVSNSAHHRLILMPSSRCRWKKTSHRTHQVSCLKRIANFVSNFLWARSFTCYTFGTTNVLIHYSQVALGWVWLIPAFHMSPDSPTSGLVLSNDDIDFAIGIGKALVDMKISFIWHSCKQS